jgi:preprotein translocase subunit SecB
VELVYGAVVTLANTAPDDVSAALMVETPRLLFPFARAILAEVTRDGGFTPLLLNPIDFNEIYARRAATPPAPTEGGPVTV